jgi:hypothetical protein
MGTKTLLQSVTLTLILEEPKGTVIRLRELYEKVNVLLTTRSAPRNAPPGLVELCNELRRCAERGDLPTEPRWKNDVRWAIRHAKNAGELRHVGTLKSGEWLRV